MATTRPHRPPFYGRGCAFPFRSDPATGGVRVTEGSTDAPSVAFEYLADRWTIREPLPDEENHVAESIAHILLTRKGEHDTLPEFGSEMESILFEPNTEETKILAEHYFCESTRRWEKRAVVNEPEGVEWHDSPEGIDRHELAAILRPEFLRTQTRENLVAPFVTPRRARAAEYELGETDGGRHDWASRYYGRERFSIGAEVYSRILPQRPYPPREDDLFYEARPLDTWLLISWKQYDDIRFWSIIVDIHVQDAAERGESRDELENLADPEPGTWLRMPNRARLLMEAVTG
jgi:phage baseplate assembly protein W